MTEKIKTSVLIVTIGAIVSVMYIVASMPQKDVLPLGSRLPSIEYRIEGGVNRLNIEGEQVSIIMYFSTECMHCVYELETLNRNTERMNQCVFYFMHSDNNFSADTVRNTWKNLFAGKKDNIVLGAVNEETFTSTFGPRMTPSYFIFNKQHILVKKIYGEVRMDVLFALLDTLKRQ
jgi:hypothetical protein